MSNFYARAKAWLEEDVDLLWVFKLPPQYRYREGMSFQQQIREDERVRKDGTAEERLALKMRTRHSGIVLLSTIVVGILSYQTTGRVVEGLGIGVRTQESGDVIDRSIAKCGGLPETTRFSCYQEFWRVHDPVSYGYQQDYAEKKQRKKRKLIGSCTETFPPGSAALTLCIIGAQN